MEPPPLSGSLNAYPMSSFSYVDSETPLKNIDQVRGKLDYENGVSEYWNHKLMKVEKKFVDLNGKANEKCRGHIESYERSREGKAKMEEKHNKGFEDSRRLTK
ncbi:ion channel POLLUX-like 2 [Pyrus ussuriensis x Pyrus communis]|uniref:Ion channel POLLUX-like 2 n=1 Tax=Pyrus ussuriensis x Pyrus communis TaxID=2448454 RepID=A0A5N5GUP9_9ROSA|nr:ion channel POLLUX-like 2 [Pyrus ussuriensis x Pyrus communis]